MSAQVHGSDIFFLAFESGRTDVDFRLKSVYREITSHDKNGKLLYKNEKSSLKFFFLSTS